MTTRGRPPNKRLKLPGPTFRGSVRSEEAYVCAPANRYRKAGRLRPPALAPQLKRDPLGRLLSAKHELELLDSTYGPSPGIRSVQPRSCRVLRRGACCRALLAHCLPDDHLVGFE